MTLALLLAAGVGAAVVACLVRLVEPGQCLVVRRAGRVVRSHGPGLAYVVPLLESAERVEVGTQHRWAVASATTLDGVTARLHVEFTISVTEPTTAPEDLDERVTDLAEEAIRRRVRSRSLAVLPGAGDAATWISETPVPGVRVGHAVVVAAEVAVSGELRRLVTSAAR